MRRLGSIRLIVLTVVWLLALIACAPYGQAQEATDDEPSFRSLKQPSAYIREAAHNEFVLQDSPLGEAVLDETPLMAASAPPERQWRAWGQWSVRLGSNLVVRTPSNDWSVAGTRMSDFGSLFAAGNDSAVRFHLNRFDLDVRVFTLFQGWQEIDYGGSYPTQVGAGSVLSSVEVLSRHQVSPNVALLGGLRVFVFNDRNAANSANWSHIDSYEICADNTLVGGEIGAEVLLWELGPRWRIDSTLKAGVFGNSIQTRYNASHYGYYFSRSRQEGSTVAFAGEINLALTYQIAEHWAVRGGYQFMALTNVGTAAGQSYSHWDSVNDKQSVLFHGAFVGLECGW